MTSGQRGDLERDLRAALDELAPAPDPGTLSTVTRRIAATPQRAVGTRQWPPTWRAMALAAAGVVAGVGVGLSVARLIDESPSVSGPASTADAHASAHVTLRPSASRPPAAAHDRDADWERLDLPDPAPGVFGGGTPGDIIEFGDAFVIVGSARGHCASDIHAPPDNCSINLAALTSEDVYQAAAAWVSDDGRRWELIASDSFDGGQMRHAATDGHRIVATGALLDPLGTERGAALWVSPDGRTWEMVTSDGPVPEHVAWTAHGWIGVRNTQALEAGRYVDAGPQFLRSDDGISWQITAEPDETGQGRVEDLAADPAGTTVIAVGYEEAVNEEGALDSSTAVVWRTLDGQVWERAPDQETFMIGPPSITYMFGVTATASGWVALGIAANSGDYDSGAWTSADGL
ncbi:MAG TPA: hypothetical protein VF364_12000, partial [Candidatus Limnocylindria bacterium]